MKKRECVECQQKKCCPCPDCKEKEVPRCMELEHKIGLKKWIFWFIFCFVIIGFLGPFLAQCILPFFVEDSMIGGLEEWNQYVGIVLGIVATILSIVSLAMGFASANEASEQQRKAFEHYESTILLLHEVQRGVKDVESKVGQNTRVGPINPASPGKSEVDVSELE